MNEQMERGMIHRRHLWHMIQQKRPRPQSRTDQMQERVDGHMQTTTTAPLQRQTTSAPRQRQAIIIEWEIHPPNCFVLPFERWLGQPTIDHQWSSSRQRPTHFHSRCKTSNNCRTSRNIISYNHRMRNLSTKVFRLTFWAIKWPTSVIILKTNSKRMKYHQSNTKSIEMIHYGYWDSEMDGNSEAYVPHWSTESA